MSRRFDTMRKKRLKKLPVLRTDRQAGAFVASADLTQYDLSGLRPVRFEFEKKSARINMRLPEPLLEAVKRSASKRGIPYQRFIREALERAVSPER
jgi:predicted DNA binding CopG/RHH family protein